jgi:hypothetical protein
MTKKMIHPPIVAYTTQLFFQKEFGGLLSKSHKIETSFPAIFAAANDNNGSERLKTEVTKFE